MLPEPSQEQAPVSTLAQSLELLSQAIAPKWARMDPDFVVEFVREQSGFDADLIESMLQFAIEAARLKFAAPSAEG
ncbi:MULTISPECIES: hypothetical protein [Pseudomonas]|uniref:hypothetical protein n=1 Tax=Pseudomonas TaxID=286 RepID=UPI001C0A8661|nr:MULTISPECIES: hypothetical protein [Pseudomonas]MCK3838608.1 hypothetical protein [Pseudomonas sp. NCIMB 10586]MCK3844449.1 hypothetical protein [Pseudomonas sp. W15Feb34]MCK3864232.1 hypothetical protein [Pseudomonas sp. B329]